MPVSDKRLVQFRPPRPFRTFAVGPNDATVSLLIPPRAAGSSGDTLETWDLSNSKKQASVVGVGVHSGPALAPPPAHNQASMGSTSQAY